MTATVLERPAVEEFVGTRETTPYQKLADYMDAGARLTLPLRGKFVVGDSAGVPYAACAISAAEVGAGVIEYADPNGFIARKSGNVWEMCGVKPDHPVTHPIEGDTCTLGYIIIDLNDSYLWPRRQIAAWLRTL